MPRAVDSIPEGAVPGAFPGGPLRTRTPTENKPRQPPSPISPYDAGLPSSTSLSPTSPTPLYSTSKGGSNSFGFHDKRSPAKSSPSLLLQTPHTQVLHTPVRAASRPMTADHTCTQQQHLSPARAPRRSVPSGSSGSTLPRVNLETRPGFAFPEVPEDNEHRAASADGQWLMAAPPLGSQPPSRPMSSQVASRAACRHSNAQAMVAENDKEALAAEWNGMMRGLDVLDISGDTDAYTLACAILLVKEGIFNYQENAPATACHCCNKAHQRDPLINVMLLDGLMGGAMTRLRQRGRTPSVPVDVDFHTITDTDRLILMTNIYGVSGKGTTQKQRYVRPRPPPAVQCEHVGVQTDAVQVPPTQSEQNGVQTDAVGCTDFCIQADLSPKPELQDSSCQSEEPEEAAAKKPKSAGELMLGGFPGVDLDKLEAFAGAAAQSLGALLELASSLRTDFSATAAQAAALSLASATMSPELAQVEGAGAEGDAAAAARLGDVATVLGACQELTSSQLEGARLVSGKPEAGDAAAAEGAEAPQDLVDALSALNQLHEELGRVGNAGHAGGENVDLEAADDASMVESGLPSLVPLLQQLQLGGTQLVRSLAAAVSACLGAGGPATAEPEGGRAEAFGLALSGAGAAAGAVQRLLRVLANKGQMAQSILTHRPRRSTSSPALELVTQFTSEAEARYSALLDWVGPALQSMQALSESWAPEDRSPDQEADAMALVQQLLASLSTWNNDLLQGLGQAQEVQDRGAKPLGMQDALKGSTPDTAAAMAANLSSLTAAFQQLYAAEPEAGAEPADKVVHASALVPLMQGQLLNAGVLLDSWLGSCHKAWDVTRAHALHEALQDKGLVSYQDLMQENATLAEKLKALEEQLESVVKEGEEALQAALAKAEAAEAALADLFGPGRGMNPEEAEAARRQISELLEELAGKAAVLEAAEKRVEELRASLEEATKNLEEMTAKLAALEAAGSKLEEMEAKLKEVEEKLQQAEKQLQEAVLKAQEAEGKLAAGEGKLEESKRQLDGSERDVAELKAKLQGKDVEHLHEIEALKKKIEELEEALRKALVKPEPPVVEKGMCGC